MIGFRDGHMCQGGKIRFFSGTFTRNLMKETCFLLTGIPVRGTVILELPLVIPAAVWETGLGMKPTQRETEPGDGE